MCLIISRLANSVIIKQSVRITLAVVISAEHLHSVGLAEAPRSADTGQLHFGIDGAIDECNHACFVNIIRLQGFSECLIAWIHMLSHKLTSCDVVEYVWIRILYDIVERLSMGVQLPKIENI